MKHYDIAVVGAGIVGLAAAYHAVQAGLNVAVFDRNPQAQGASVRNFGMLALVAQSAGDELTSARSTLSDWQALARDAGVSLHRSGCLFLARAPQEMAVLEERAALQDGADIQFSLLRPDQLPDYAAPAQDASFLGGLYSPDTYKVDQRAAMTQIASWLMRERGVSFHFNTPVRAVQSGMLETPSGHIKATQTIICGGDEFAALFPHEFAASGVGRCRLQMLRSVPQTANWRFDPFILGGLSTVRYSAFAACPSLPALKEYQRRNFADHLDHGIHLIACQEADGSVTIGDSHAYGVDHADRRSDKVDDLILDELGQLITLPDPRIAERWLGHYAHHPSGKTLILTPAPDVTAVTLTNGQGMTHGFDVAKTLMQRLG